MQERMIDGSYGEPRPFDEKEMKNMLKDPNVDRVEVFKATPKKMTIAKKKAKRKKNKQARKARKARKT